MIFIMFYFSLLAHNELLRLTLFEICLASVGSPTAEEPRSMVNIMHDENSIHYAYEIQVSSCDTIIHLIKFSRSILRRIVILAYLSQEIVFNLSVTTTVFKFNSLLIIFIH